MDTVAFDNWNERTTKLQNKYGHQGVDAFTLRYRKKQRPEINPQNKPNPFPKYNIKFPYGTPMGIYEGTTIQGTHVFSKVNHPHIKKGLVNADGKRIDGRSLVGKWSYRIQGEV